MRYYRILQVISGFSLLPHSSSATVTTITAISSSKSWRIILRSVVQMKYLFNVLEKNVVCSGTVRFIIASLLLLLEFSSLHSPRRG